jgi:hypothetical protein
MADSKRQDIIDALDTLLKTIKTTAGYETNLGSNVKEFDETAMNESESPKCIHRDMGQISAEQDFDSWIHDLTIMLDLEVVGSIATMRKCIADVTKALGSDNTLGGLAIKIKPPTDQIGAEHKEKFIVGAIMKFVVRYETASWNPYA